MLTILPLPPPLLSFVPLFMCPVLSNILHLVYLVPYQKDKRKPINVTADSFLVLQRYEKMAGSDLSKRRKHLRRHKHAVFHK